jgi:hypothetical protein
LKIYYYSIGTNGNFNAGIIQDVSRWYWAARGNPWVPMGPIEPFYCQRAKRNLMVDILLDVNWEDYERGAIF